MKHFTTCYIFLLVIFAGCTGMQKQRSPEAIVRTHKLFTRESSVGEWQERMELEGFECEMVENGMFSTTYKKKHRIDNADFLRCRRGTANGVNDVALVVEDGIVTDVIIDFESK